MPRFNLGIDTGGTYTDAALLDMGARQVVATAKELTTHDNLTLGVTRALHQVLANAVDNVSPQDIALVSLSTTLATNALVEGKRSNVGVFLIGFNDAMEKRTNISEAMPEADVMRIDGGHRYTGEEQMPLDEPSIEQVLRQNQDRWQAYAVAAHYAVRNSSHERRAEALIQRLTGRPVTASRDLSDALDGPRRALTAALNASIVSKVVALLNAVSESLRTHGIQAPLMIVKGDGSLATAKSVAKKPIETILSGPAASVIGARFLTGLSEFAVADIGGTTTDVAIAHDGWPELSESGSRVGGYRTLIKAIEMQTVGLGGDSRVEADFHGRVSLGRDRVIPLSLLATQWPRIIGQMESALLSAKGLRKACRFVLRLEDDARVRSGASLSAPDRELLSTIGTDPRPYSLVVRRAADERRLARLIRQGVVQVAGVTPSDAAHVLGLQKQWSVEAARLGCQLLGRACGKVGRDSESVKDDLDSFAHSIVDAVVKASTHLLAGQLCGASLDPNDALVSAVISGRHRMQQLSIAMQPLIPIISVGGPAGIYYPLVGERLNTEVVLPDGSEVANAIGAAAGMVRTQSTVEITQNEQGSFMLHHEGDPLLVSGPTEALSQAEIMAQNGAQEACKAMGAEHLEVNVDVKRIDLPHMERDHGLVAAYCRCRVHRHTTESSYTDALTQTQASAACSNWSWPFSEECSAKKFCAENPSGLNR